MMGNDIIKQFSYCCIPHPGFDEILDVFEDCRVNSKRTDEPLCALIKGDKGVGKTVAIEAYCMRFPSEILRDHTRIPVLAVEIPESATPGALVSELLTKIGDPNPDRGTRAVRTRRLKRLLKTCETELIILDEFQHFLDGTKRNRTIEQTADWLKGIINQSKIPIVLVGMPSSGDILKLHPQLDRRFFKRTELRCFQWDKEDNGKEFRSLLEEMGKNIKMQNKVILSEVEFAYRFYRATGGVIGLVKKTIIRALLAMEKQNAPALTIGHFAKTYEEKYGFGDNPFSMKTDLLASFKLPTTVDTDL